MTIEQLISIFGAVALLVMGAWALIRIVVWQFEKRLDERFLGMEEKRKEGRKSSDARFAALDDKYDKLQAEVREILIEMPRQFVERTDYIRRESVIEGKIDQLSLRIQDWIMEKRND